MEIFERNGDTGKQGHSLNCLACALYQDGQLDATEEAASRAIQLLSEKGQEFRICPSHLILGRLYEVMGETEKAFYHLKATLGITSRFGWNNWLSFWAHMGLARVFAVEDKFDDAHTHLEQAKSLPVNNAFNQGSLALLQARVYYEQRRLADATSEALRALGIFEELGIQEDIESCRDFLRGVEEKAKGCDTSEVSLWERCHILHLLTLPS